MQLKYVYFEQLKKKQEKYDFYQSILAKEHNSYFTYVPKICTDSEKNKMKELRRKGIIKIVETRKYKYFWDYIYKVDVKMLKEEINKLQQSINQYKES